MSGPALYGRDVRKHDSRNGAAPSIVGTFMNRPGVECLLWIAVQQTVVAASTVCIVVAVRCAADGLAEKAAAYSAAFVVSLLVVYIPNVISVACLQRWKVHSYRSFVEAFISRNRMLATRFNSAQKQLHESWLTHESVQVYERATAAFYESTSLVFSVAFNVVAIALSLDAPIIGAYACAAALVCVAAYLLRNRIGAVATRLQQSRRDLGATVLKAWDNIFSGNDHLIANWSVEFEARLSALRRAAVAYDASRAAVSGSMAVAAALCIAAFVAAHYRSKWGDVSAMAPLIVTLPRQAQLVQAVLGFFNAFLECVGVTRQLRALASVMESGGVGESLQRHVDVDAIAVSADGAPLPFSSPQHFIEQMQGRSRGRVTLRGRNGSGKSVLLAMLAESTGVDRFYLPTRVSELSFATNAAAEKSDGGRMQGIFDEMRDFERYPLLILDEWDANLDSANLLALDAAIDRIATRRLVVEARHRKRADSPTAAFSQ